ncbi:MAG: ATP-binding cassette domain-containing protein [Pseudonocardia sp.]|nr:ATP-binding cassette domain-containing protein [Pseudonocardia sp.]MBO0877525.1 ATP-binding cassette domain-containing protein [Pseudonocardia sp.]
MKITVRDAAVFYGGAVAIDGISMTISEDEGLAVVGRNGAGKTSLLRVLAGVIKPHRGSITVDECRGRWSVASAVAAGVRFVPESGNTFPDLSVMDNLRSGWPMGPGRKVEARIDEVLDYFPLLRPLTNRRAGNLSGGERQALAVGRALVGEVRLLLLDEPSLGLSPRLGLELLDHLETIRRRRGITVVIAEQNLAFATRLCAQLCWLQTGRLRALGPAGRLAADVREDSMT